MASKCEQSGYNPIPINTYNLYNPIPKKYQTTNDDRQQTKILTFQATTHKLTTKGGDYTDELSLNLSLQMAFINRK